MSMETKRKSAFVGLFVMVAVVLVAITFIVTKSSVATSYSVASPGMIHRAFVTYKDSDTITIQPGYGECSLSYWEITSPLDHDMTSLATGEDFHYIYIDDVNSVYPTPTIIDRTTEPVWSDSKLGWYNGYDRCIGVVWSPDGGATLTQFDTNSNLNCIWGTDENILLDANPTGSWETLEATAYMPVNVISVRCEFGCADWDSKVTAKLTAYGQTEKRGAHLVAVAYSNWAQVSGWIDIPKGHSRDLEWAGGDDDDNRFYVRIWGYQIER